LLSFKVEIRRIYVQDGQQIQNTQVAIDGVDPYDSVTDAYCTSIKAAFGDEDDHAKKGGLKRMGEALDKGMVLALSLWDDHFAQMHWLDAVYPEDGTDPGDLRGPCDPNGGNPAEIEQQFPNAQVTFGKLKVGPIGSTF
jgi:cellulose 1,4-beta-cellobiosidase